MSCGAGSRVPAVASFDELLMMVVAHMQNESSVLDGRTHSESRLEHFWFYQAMAVFSEDVTPNLTEPYYTMLKG